MAEKALTYRDYIAGKRVAFVAPSRYFSGCGNGAEIDGFDVVVRTNGFHDILDDYAADYGTRCDVLYVNVQYYREVFPLSIGHLRKRGVAWMCMKVMDNEDMRRYGRHINVRMIEKEVVRQVVQDLPSYTYGNFIWTELLSMGPAELKIFNADFFAFRPKRFIAGDYSYYLNGYLPANIQNQGDMINAHKTEDSHDFHGNAAYTMSLFRKYPNLTADPATMEILEKITNGEIDQQ